MPQAGAEEHNLHFNDPLDPGFATSPDVLPPPQPLSVTQVFELVQSLLGHTTWLTEAMGNSNEGTVCWLVPFTQMETRLPQDCPPPRQETELRTVTMWL